jgi:predicted amidophosphoribosyltransferase
MAADSTKGVRQQRPRRGADAFLSVIFVDSTQIPDKNELRGRVVAGRVYGRGVWLVDAVFPAVCVGCGRRGAAVCAACVGTLAPATGAPPPPPFVDEWFACYAYDGLVRELVARIKYRNSRAVLPFFADAIVDRLRWNVDAVTWPPTTTARRRERGFDHAALLARAVARRLDVPAPSLLTRATRAPQTGRPYAQRHDGVRFTSTTPAAHTVLLVDDVATTGATLRAAARALRDAGVKRVVAATVARTPPPTRSPSRRSAERAYTPPR